MSDAPDSRLAARLGLVLLALWSATCLYLLASGQYVFFLNPALWPLLLLAALLSGGFLTALAVLPPGHGMRSDAAWVRTGVLALPLLYVVCGYGQTLNSDDMVNRSVGGITNTDGLGGLGNVDEAFGPQTAKEDHLNVLQVVRRGRALVGSTVTTRGQVARGVGEPEGHLVIFRFVMTCCAADARPVGLLVDAEGHPLPDKDDWVLVEGRVEATTIEGKPAHVIRATSLTRIARPKEPYIYGF